jgi:hypothetical protein
MSNVPVFCSLLSPTVQKIGPYTTPLKVKPGLLELGESQPRVKSNVPAFRCLLSPTMHKKGRYFSSKNPLVCSFVRDGSEDTFIAHCFHS